LRHRQTKANFIVVPHTRKEATAFMNAEYQQELSVVMTGGREGMERMAEETVPKAVLAMNEIQWHFL
jgi:hypothetical protein